MMPTHALMESVSANLQEFLQPIGVDLTKPQKKFLREGLLGLLRARRPVVSRMARKLPDRRSKFLSRLDLSDLAKPLAKKMDYLAMVRDGSTGKLVNGYWLIEIYASLWPKNPVPIVLEPFSHEQPFSRGQNPIIIEAVRKVFELTDGCGVLVIDRGGDAIRLLADWLDHDYRLVVRLRGDRDLMRFYGVFGGSLQMVQTLREGQWVSIRASLLAEQISTDHRSWRTVKRKGKPKLRFSQLGWVAVRLPGRKETLTMVVARTPGKDVPFMLLTNLPVESADGARRVLRYYARR